jgi:uncharacterized coiled-coil DUF342 family protein
MDTQTLYLILAIVFAASVHLFILCRLIAKVSEATAAELKLQADQREVRLEKALQELVKGLASVAHQMRASDDKGAERASQMVSALELRSKELSEAIERTGKGQRDESKEVAKEVRNSSGSLERAIAAMTDQLRGFKESMAELSRSNLEVRAGMTKLAEDIEAAGTHSSGRISKSLEELNKVLIEATKL